MPTIIRSGGGGGMDVSAANATTSQVLSGATFYSNASDDIQIGTMNNKGAVSQAAPYSGSAGYYGSISVTTTGTATNAHVLSGKTFMNADGAQNGAMVDYSSKTTINVGEKGGAGYYSSISINKSSLGNATNAHVLNTVTFTNNAGTTQAGAIATYSAFSCVLGYGESTSANGAGYYSSISVNAPSRYGNATAAYVYNEKTFMNTTGNQTGSLKLDGTAGTGDVLSGKTFHAGNSITQKTGTMPNRGQFYNASVGTSWSNSGAGYYTSINVKGKSASDYYRVDYFNVGASICNTGIVYNSSRSYGVAYVDLPTSGSATNKCGLKFYNYSGYLILTQQCSGSACQRNVRLITIY